MRNLRMWVFLLVWAGAASPVALRAQINSPAFDPHCYQPVIGTPGVIDTIMGANGQGLGQGLINIGPSPNDTGGPGRLMMYGMPGTLGDSSAAILTVGPNFNPANLNITKMLGFKPDNPIMGHFRSSQYMDMLVRTESTNPEFHLPRIYWQKDDGTYDSSFCTTLLPDADLYRYIDPTYLEGLNPPYHAHLTSDSVEDIVILYLQGDGITLADSENACLFIGGANLFHPGDTVLPDSKAFFDSTKNVTPGSAFLVNIGDFRGTGREDMVGLFNSSRNMLFYSNDTPFTLDKFITALKTDTLFSIYSAPSWVNPAYFGLVPTTIRMHDGGSQSFIFLLDSAYLQGDWAQARIFEGGPTFGSHPFTFDNTLTIHTPALFDGGNFRESGWGLDVADCGNMAGTGDHVLGVTGNFGDDGSFFTFYVLGNSFDEKVDMYFAEYPYGGGTIDTATLDGDNLQDIAIGAPAFPALITNGMQYNGSVLFVHGSHQIPAVGQSVATAVPQQETTDPFSVTQSADGNTLFVHAWHGMFVHATAILHDILGRAIVTAEETHPLIDWQMPIPPHAAGAYVLTILTDDKVYTYKLALLQ